MKVRATVIAQVDLEELGWKSTKVTAATRGICTATRPPWVSARVALCDQDLTGRV